ncbi:DNA cytosine methyltransferase [Thomasclavelia cocleata]|uniref:DNA cytosine methyltransferase n=1 Tax=Thomasclavelia cocleata TaxID=69824 RepID=UPI00248B3C36|nr:DNA cytosine methyltransferase [Thomasclavelia cocleata]
MKYNFIDLFCGAGGFSKGLELAGMNCIGGIDNVEKTVETHKLNHRNSQSICGDIREISPKEFAKIIGNQRVDVIIGGPPCPTFSTIGDAKIRSVTGRPTREDPRNQLFMEYLKYVEYFRPEIFVIENVPNFITKYKGEIFNEAIRIIKDIGKDKNGEGIYTVDMPVQVLNSVYYGVPQTRRRMMLVAHKKKGVKFNYPKHTHYYDQDDISLIEKLKPFVSMGEAIFDLPKITDNWRVSEVKYSKNDNLTEYQKIMRENNLNNTVKNNICRMSNDRAKQVFSYMKQGDIYMDLPKEVRNILPFREDIFPDRLKRLVADQPSWTIIAHIGMDGYMYIHPTECRTLSVREAARIQSFPDDFEFVGNQQQTYVQVGNAVPPLLGKAIGNSLIEYLDKINKER